MPRPGMGGRTGGSSAGSGVTSSSGGGVGEGEVEILEPPPDLNEEGLRNKLFLFEILVASSAVPVVLSVEEDEEAGPSSSMILSGTESGLEVKGSSS